jgi:hypothetical protein
MYHFGNRCTTNREGGACVACNACGYNGHPCLPVDRSVLAQHHAHQERPPRVCSSIPLAPRITPSINMGLGLPHFLLYSHINTIQLVLKPRFSFIDSSYPSTYLPIPHHRHASSTLQWILTLPRTSPPTAPLPLKVNRSRSQPPPKLLLMVISS